MRVGDGRQHYADCEMPIGMTVRSMEFNGSHDINDVTCMQCVLGPRWLKEGT